MIVSNIYLNYEDSLSYDSKPERRVVDSRQLGTSATHRLYECSGGSAPMSPHGNPEPRWVMVVADDDEAVAQLFASAGRPDLMSDDRFATAARRLEHRTDLEDELVPAFLTSTALQWEERLLAAGVGCTIADAASHFSFLYEDPQAIAAGMMTTTSHPTLGGSYYRNAPVLALSDTPSQAPPFSI